MNTKDIIKLGKRLGLTFNENTNFPVNLKNNNVCFDGCNGQRFLFEGNKLSDDEIYKLMGDSLVLQGQRMKALALDRILSITGDHL